MRHVTSARVLCRPSAVCVLSCVDVPALMCTLSCLPPVIQVEVIDLTSCYDVFGAHPDVV